MAEQHSYNAAKEAFIDAVRVADPGAVVPACPEWTVHELLAHQVHQLQGALDGTFPAADALDRLTAPSDSARTEAAHRQERWISRGVAELSKVAIDDLIGSWTDLARNAPVEVLDALVPDVVVHLFDLLGVLADVAYRDHKMVQPALQFWAAAAGIVEMPENARDRYELLRAITGRRSKLQAPGLDDRIALYGWRSEDLLE